MKFNLEAMNEKDSTRIEKAISTYLGLQEGVRSTEPLNDEFKKNYCKFYGLNRCFTEEDKKVYFSVFEEQRKTKLCDFQQILLTLSSIKGRRRGAEKVWVSFASKMLASIDPSLPVWDSVVYQKLHKERGLPYLPNYKMSIENKIAKAAECYQKLKDCIDRLKAEADQQDFFNRFRNKFLQDKELTTEKMLDFYLWGVRNQ